jgi:spore germination cell wall hydrolase CwlJ-like protein
VSRLIAESAWGIVTVYLEAEGESVDGKTAVAEVILRRTRLKFQSDGTVAGTCLHPYAFSAWNTKSVNRTRGALLDAESMMGTECLLAWERAVAGSNLSHDAVFYWNPVGQVVTPAWATPSHKVAQIGKHHFYVDRLPPEMTA